MLGAFFSEITGGVLSAFVAAPVGEEIFKPLGVYFLFGLRPWAVRNRFQTAALAALGGLSFALVESLIYVTVYFPNEGPEYLAFRFTVPVAMHVTCSLIFGLGITRQVFWNLTHGKGLPGRSWPFFVTAMAIHAAYNITVTVTEIADAE